MLMWKSFGLLIKSVSILAALNLSIPKVGHTEYTQVADSATKSYRGSSTISTKISESVVEVEKPFPASVNSVGTVRFPHYPLLLG